VQGVRDDLPACVDRQLLRGGGLRGAMISQLFPGKTVGASSTTQFYVMEKKPEDEAAIKAAHEQFDFLEYRRCATRTTRPASASTRRSRAA